MHSSRMRTTRRLPHGSLLDRGPPGLKPPLDRDPMDRDPPDRDPSGLRTPWTETPLSGGSRILPRRGAQTPKLGLSCNFLLKTA